MSSVAKTTREQRGHRVRRASGVEWLGAVPEEWNVLRLKYAAELVNQKLDGAACQLPYTGLEHIESWTGKRLALDAETWSDGQASRHRAGDVLFGKLRPYLAKVYAAQRDGICTGEFLVLRPKALVQSFLRDYLLNPSFVSIVDSSTYGAKMPRASWDFIGNLPVLVPPLDEQHAIVRFLDRETARIDALIEKKRRQIELLHEKRAAVISHAVTKGLDPKAPMRDSGIEWLDKIPEHWRALRLATLCDKITNGYVGPTRDILVPEGVPYLQSLHIKGNRIVFDGRYFVTQSWSAKHAKSILRQCDVLVVQTGGIGQVAVVPKDFEGANCHALIILSSRPEYVVGEFLSLVLNSRYGFHSLKRVQTGALHPHLNCTFVREIYVPVPPLREQAAIVRSLQAETQRNSHLIDRIVQSIEMLREYRTALISAAVTGKIDVRQEVA